MSTPGNIQIEHNGTRLTCHVTHDGYPDHILNLLVHLLQEEGPHDFEAFKRLYCAANEAVAVSFESVFPGVGTWPDFSYKIMGNQLLVSSYILNSEASRVNATCHPLDYISMLEPDYRDEAVRSINASLASLEALGIVLHTSFVKPTRPAALDCRA